MRNCLACSTAFCKVKLKSIHCAVRLVDDIGYMSELQMSVVKLTMATFSKYFKLNLNTCLYLFGIAISGRKYQFGNMKRGSKCLIDEVSTIHIFNNRKELVIQRNDFSDFLCYQLCFVDLFDASELFAAICVVAEHFSFWHSLHTPFHDASASV